MLKHKFSFVSHPRKGCFPLPREQQQQQRGAHGQEQQGAREEEAVFARCQNMQSSKRCHIQDRRTMRTAKSRSSDQLANPKTAPDKECTHNTSNKQEITPPTPGGRSFRVFRKHQRPPCFWRVRRGVICILLVCWGGLQFRFCCLAFGQER
jgi:hypothetical protein